MKIFINILVWIFILIFNIYLKTTGERSGTQIFLLKPGITVTDSCQCKSIQGYSQLTAMKLWAILAKFSTELSTVSHSLCKSFIPRKIASILKLCPKKVSHVKVKLTKHCLNTMTTCSISQNKKIEKLHSPE